MRRDVYSTFIACRDECDGNWYMPAVGHAVVDIEKSATLLGPVPRTVTLEMSEGAVFYGLQTTDPQLLDSTFKFSWDQLPKAV